MADTMDWVQIWHNHPKPIGAIGFIGDKAVAVASFYRDADTDRNGKVSTAEKLKFRLPLAPKGQAVVHATPLGGSVRAHHRCVAAHRSSGRRPELHRLTGRYARSVEQAAA